MCRQHYDIVRSLPAAMTPLIRATARLLRAQTQCDNFKLAIGLKALQQHIKS